MGENGSYKLMRYFRCENNMSSDFLEVLPNEVTITKKFNQRLFLETLDEVRRRHFRDLIVHCDDTPFEEVNLVPYKQIMLPEVSEFLKEKYHRKIITPRQYADRIFKAMKKAIASSWDSSKFHVVTHSSGYDTRIIASALRELYEENGDSWLGDLIFLEADGEAPWTKKLLELEGWGDFPFIVYNRSRLNKWTLEISSEEQYSNDYHELSFDFENTYKRYNSIAGYPVNCWYEPIEWCQKEGIIPKNDDKLQSFTGFGSNEIALSFNLFVGLKWYFEWIYYHALACFNTKGQWVYPFWNLDLLRVLRENRKLRYRKTGLSKAVMKYMAPHTMEVPNLTTYMRNDTVRKLSNEIIEKAVKDYKNSWYGQNVNSSIRPKSDLVEYSLWWGSWCMASLCEHLIKAGYNINVS